jgi:hypothetical protein
METDMKRLLLLAAMMMTFGLTACEEKKAEPAAPAAAEAPKAAEGEAKPAEGEAKPAEGGAAAPAEGEAAPESQPAH